MTVTFVVGRTVAQFNQAAFTRSLALFCGNDLTLSHITMELHVEETEPWQTYVDVTIVGPTAAKAEGAAIVLRTATIGQLTLNLGVHIETMSAVTLNILGEEDTQGGVVYTPTPPGVIIGPSAGGVAFIIALFLIYRHRIRTTEPEPEPEPEQQDAREALAGGIKAIMAANRFKAALEKNKSPTELRTSTAGAIKYTGPNMMEGDLLLLKVGDKLGQGVNAIMAANRFKKFKRDVVSV